MLVLACCVFLKKKNAGAGAGAGLAGGLGMRRVDCGVGYQVPLFSTACHSSSLFCTGYDMFFELELLKREPKKGIVGIDLRTVPLVKGSKALYCDAVGRVREAVALVMV